MPRWQDILKEASQRIAYLNILPTTFVRPLPDTRCPTTSSQRRPCLSSTNSLWRVQRLSSALTPDQTPRLQKSTKVPLCGRKEDTSENYLGTPSFKPLPYFFQLLI